MDLLMGIDLGSTSLKAICYDLDGNIVAQGSTPTKLTRPADHPEWAIWEHEDIWGGTAAACREAVSQIADPRDIKAVAVTGMGMDGVPISPEGEILYPFISWHDGRTASQFEWWKRNVTCEKTFSIGGNPVWPINAAMRIRWMMENEPEILAKTEKWLLIEDFLNFMLTGRKATDYSMASCMALFDQQTKSWSEELLELSEINPELMPEPLPSGSLLGEITSLASARTGLPEGTPVILGGHDHLCGALPVGAHKEGVALNVAGTWEMILTPTVKPLLDPALQAMGMTAQSHVAPEMMTIWGGNPAAGMLEWYREQYGQAAKHQAEAEGVSDWEILIKEAEQTEAGAGGVMFLPHMTGASCPMVDDKSRGALVGMTGRATAGDIFRALIEGLCYQYNDMLTSLESCLPSKLDRCVTVGGVTRNKFWMQTKANIIGRPVELPAVEEATPLGAAILAGIGVGLYSDIDEAYERVYRPGETFQPDESLREKYENSFEIYQELYPALKPINQRLA